MCSFIFEVPHKYAMLTYWLSNISALLLLLQQKLKASEDSQSPTFLLRMMSSSLGLSSQSLGLSSQSLVDGRLSKPDDVRQVEDKYPALLFKQQLTTFLEKIYGMIRDKFKIYINKYVKFLMPANDIDVPDSLMEARDLARANSWKVIVESLNNYLNMLKANNVPPFLARKIYSQIFSFINLKLFNSLLFRRECCSSNYGEYLKAGLAELEQWCIDAAEEYGGLACMDELKHISQAVRFFVIHDKPRITLHQITRDLCPALNIKQLYIISTKHWDDKYGTDTISSEVISSMGDQMREDANWTAQLTGDSSIPFSLDDIFGSMQQSAAGDVDLSEILRLNSGFSFLIQNSE